MRPRGSPPASALSDPALSRSGGRWPGIDSLRGLTGLAVVLLHGWLLAGRPRLDGGPVRALLASSYLTVDIFFVLSGLVLFLPLATGPMDSRRGFLARRVARLGPMYLVAMTIALVAHRWLVTGTVPLHPHTVAGWRLLGLYFWFGWGSNGVVWTLAIEASFYLLLCIVANAYRRHPWAGLTIAFLLAWSYRRAVTHLASWVPLLGVHVPSGGPLVSDQLILLATLPTYLAHFALGMTVAVVVVRHRDGRVGRALTSAAPALFVIGGFGVLRVLDYAGTHDLRNTNDPYARYGGNWPLVAFLGLLLLGSALAGPRLRAVLECRPLRFLAANSYGVYLIHLMLEEFVHQSLHVPGNGSVRSLLLIWSVIPLAYLVGALSRRWFEVPVGQWLRRALVPAPRPPTPPPPTPPPPTPPPLPPRAVPQISDGDAETAVLVRRPMPH
ncbi:MAG: acyltransferase family protein [Mycobacteriales bacterium]